MSSTERDWKAVYHIGFFWSGVLMTVACLALVLAGNTELGYRLEHTGFPLSWAFAGFALIQFLAAELCQPERSLNNGRRR